MYRDLAEAVGALYGESTFGMHTARPNDLGGLNEQDDLAEAWIRGEHTRVLEAVALHTAKVRARPVIVKYVSKKKKILELRKRGWTTRKIAALVPTTPAYVAHVCRKFGVGPTRGPRKVDRFRLASLRLQGLTLKEIAKMENLSRFTVCRVLRGKQ